MKRTKNYYLMAKIKQLSLILIYILFCLYTLKIIIDEQNFYVKITFGAILIVFISISLWAEYLRILYGKSISKLNIELDPYQAIKLFEKLNKKDFFKSYSKTFLIFKILYNMSIKEYTECIKIVDENDKFFRSSLDNLLIRKYTYFFCYYKLQDKENTQKYYLELQKMKNAKIKSSKLSPLYNWEFIDAIYFKAKNNFQKSKYSFENTNTVNMNKRELIDYFVEYEDLLLKLNLNDQAKKVKQKIKKLR